MQIADIDFCSVKDLNELCAVESACFPAPWPRHVIVGDIENGDVVYIKAIIMCRIAGYSVIARSGEKESHLMNIAVLPEFRRAGIASQLLAAVGEIALYWGCGGMRLEVRVSNAAARNFYTKSGFKYDKTINAYYSDGEAAWTMLASLPFPKFPA
ncbi:N-acetyltransferase [Synergistales bacterium]|nr:N-acetyltransferase [Synergistales bacterium]